MDQCKDGTGTLGGDEPVSLEVGIWQDVVEPFLVLVGGWTRTEIHKLESLVNKVLLEHSHAHSFMYYL